MVQIMTLGKPKEGLRISWKMDSKQNISPLNTVAYDEGNHAKLKKELFLGDALSDLPPVENNEMRGDDMEYVEKPGSELQQFIRLGRDGGLPGTVLLDHRPLQLSDDDYQRVCHIPKAKVPDYAMSFVGGTSLKPF